MEKITEYIFSIGTIKELREGNLSKMQISARYLKSFFDREMKKRIIIPKFIGIYQRDALIIQTAEDRIAADGEDFNKSFTDSGLSLARLFLRIKDDIAPSLIHVVYDKRILPEKSFIRQSLEDSLGRVAISDIEMLPDFGMKNTASIQRVRDVLTSAYIKSKETGNIGEYEKKHDEKTKDLAEGLRIQREKYGLTRNEYTYLSVVEAGDNSEAECRKSKIYKPDSVLSELIEYMAKNKK